MLQKFAVLQKIVEVGLVAVIRAESAEQAKKITDACIQGGVAAIERRRLPQSEPLLSLLLPTGG